MAYRSKVTGRYVKGTRPRKGGRHDRRPTAIEKARRVARRRRSTSVVFGPRPRQHRPRLYLHGRTFTRMPHSPYRARYSKMALNPYPLMEVGAMTNPRHRRRRHSRNPMGAGVVGSVQSMFKNPVNTLMDGTLGAVSAYLTISIPNQFLPYPGSDMMSRVIRLVSRVAAGGLVTMLGRKVLPGSGSAIASGAAIGAVGGAVLDFLGSAVVIGRGDTAQTPMALFSNVGLGAYASFRGLGAYTRPQVALASMNRGVAAPAIGPRQIVGHRLFGG